MSTKPGTVYNWTGTISAPSSGKQAAGWVADEEPPCEYFNWLFNGAALWQQWLSDGNCTFANLAATGTLTITGAATAASTFAVGGLLTASGGISVPTGQSVVLNGTTGLTVGSNGAAIGGLLNANGGLAVAGTITQTGGGATALSGTLGVTGAITASAGVSVPTGQAVALNGTTTLNVGGLVTANAGLTAAANQDVTVSGTGKHRHGSRVVSRIYYQANEFISFAGAAPTTIGGGLGVNIPSGAGVYVPLPQLPTSKRITGVQIWFTSSAGALNASAVNLVQTTDVAFNTSGSAFSSSLTSTGVTLARSGASWVVTSLTAVNTGSGQYMVSVSMSSAAVLAAIVVQYDE